MAVDKLTECLIHGQLINLFIEDFFEFEDESAQAIASMGRLSLPGTNNVYPYQDQLKMDTEKTAYLHNHGYTPQQLIQMGYQKRCALACEWAARLRKSVIAE